jgi:ketosteroid isomerase-like protein
MRTILLRSVLMLAIAFPVSFAAVGASTTDEAELRRLSVAWMQALEKKDAPALENILAQDYVLQMPGDMSSQYTVRSEWLKNAIGMDWTRFRYENLDVRVNGDQAEVSSRLYFHVSPIPLELDSAVIDTWSKRDGRWQVTRRYLGQSHTSDRFQLMLGFGAALVLGVLALVFSKLFRWLRNRSA